MRRARIICGIAIWIGIASGFAWCTTDRLAAEANESHQVIPRLWQFLTAPRAERSIQIPQAVLLTVGDPIFFVDDDGRIHQVGKIAKVVDPKSGRPVASAAVTAADAVFHPGAPLSADSELIYHESRNSLDWVVRTMMPADKQQLIAGEIARAFDEHRDATVEELKPIVRRSLMDAARVVEQDFGRAFVRHRAEFETLAERYQRELVEEDIIPLVREEIWPVVVANAEPAAHRIGRALWNRVSIWGFAWRYLYDLSPLPERDRLRGEFNRFVNEEAIPELESQTDEIIAMIQEIVVEASKNEQVKKVLREGMAEITNDLDFQQLLWQIVRETVIENPQLHDVIEQHWRSPEADQALRMASQRFEPVARRIGDMVIGTREGGITPEFARVLRNQILSKDRRWLILHSTANGDQQIHGTDSGKGILHVRIGRNPTVNPFVRESLPSAGAESLR